MWNPSHPLGGVRVAQFIRRDTSLRAGIAAMVLLLGTGIGADADDPTWVE